VLVLVLVLEVLLNADLIQNHVEHEYKYDSSRAPTPFGVTKP